MPYWFQNEHFKSDNNFFQRCLHQLNQPCSLADLSNTNFYFRLLQHHIIYQIFDLEGPIGCADGLTCRVKTANSTLQICDHNPDNPNKDETTKFFPSTGDECVINLEGRPMGKPPETNMEMTGNAVNLLRGDKAVL